MLVRIAMASMSVPSLALTSFGAQAMPTSSALSQTRSYDVTKVAGGCGVGFYRGPLGGCVRGGSVVVAPRPVVVAPRPVVVAPRPVVVAPRTVVRPRPVVIDRRPIVIR